MSKSAVIDLRELKNAWLSPSGEIVVDAEDFDPKGAFHEALADCILRDLLGFRSASEVREQTGLGHEHDYAYEWLESLGWIRYCHWSLRWVVACRMTEAQEETIRAWCETNNMSYAKCVDIVL